MAGNERYFDSLNVGLMLLGPAERKDYREQVRIELIERGITRVILMEEEIEKLKDISLDDKFHRIIEEKNPTLFIAFFHNGVRMDESLSRLDGCVVNIVHQPLTKNLKFLLRKTMIYLKQLHIFRVYCNEC
jgi:hypothetical protein